jgi:hypothetical protein
MTSDEQRRLEELRLRQEELFRQLAGLGREIQALESSVQTGAAPIPADPTVTTGSPAAMPLLPLTEVKGAPIGPGPSGPWPEAPVGFSPVPRNNPAMGAAHDPTAVAYKKTPSAPPEAQTAAPAAHSLLESPRTSQEMDQAKVAKQDAASQAPINLFARRHHTGSTPPSRERTSLEMHVGARWLPVVGVITLLIGVVIGANYVMTHSGGRLAAGQKIGALYFASFALLGLGVWLERTQESLRQYGRVLAAGGLAAVYFTTHYAGRLGVIPSPLITGLLKLGWAGLIVVIAQRRRSELLALFGLGLAYHAAIITKVESFTLVSSLMLAAAGAFLMVRNSWVRVPFASLVASYLTFAGWRSPWSVPAVDYWRGNLFLLGCWALFTSAVFLSRLEEMARTRRAAFLTINNLAFFVFTWLNTPVHSGVQALGYGAALIALALAARRVLAGERIVGQSYLAQGLVFATAGLAAWLPDNPRPVVIAAESVILLTLGVRFKDTLLQTAGHVAGFAALALVPGALDRVNALGPLVGGVAGGLLAFNAVWLRRAHDAELRPTLDPSRAYFSGLALVAWLMTTLKYTPSLYVAPVLAVEALVLTISCYAFKVRELTLFGQGFLFLAQLHWLWKWVFKEGSPPWWNPALLIAITLAIHHWWRRQTRIEIGKEVRLCFEAMAAAAVVGVVHFWANRELADTTWLVFACLLGVGVSGYGLATRSWFLAGGGQWFLLAGVVQFARMLLVGIPSTPEAVRFWSLIPAASLVGVAVAARKWLQQDLPGRSRFVDPVHLIGWSYGTLAVAMTLAWVRQYIALEHHVWSLGLIGTVLFLWGGRRQHNELLAASGVFWAAACAICWILLRGDLAVFWPNVAAFVTLGALQQLAKRSKTNFNLKLVWHRLMVLAAGCSLWLWVSRLVQHRVGPFSVTIAWTGVALVIFVVGFSLSERSYRLLGLGVLVASLLRAGSDVRKLDQVYQAVGFLALGAVMLLLALVYNRYQKFFLDDEWLAQFYATQIEKRIRRRRRRSA